MTAVDVSGTLNVWPTHDTFEPILSAEVLLASVAVKLTVNATSFELETATVCAVPILPVTEPLGVAVTDGVIEMLPPKPVAGVTVTTYAALLESVACVGTVCVAVKGGATDKVCTTLVE